MNMGTQNFVGIPVGYPANVGCLRTESCWGTQNFVGTRGVPSECWLSADRVLLGHPELCGYPWGTQHRKVHFADITISCPWVPVGELSECPNHL